MLKKKAQRWNIIRVVVSLFLLTGLLLFFSALALGIITFEPGVTQAGAAAIVMLIIILFLFGLTAIWADSVPPSLTMAERIKYRLDRKVKLCERYNKFHTDRRERWWPSRRLLRESRRLLGDLAPYSTKTQNIPRGTSASTDLFVGQLSEFADDAIAIARLISSLVKSGKPLPDTALARLRNEGFLLESDHTVLTLQHTAELTGAIQDLEAAGARPDMSLGRSIGEQLAVRLGRRFRTLSAKGWGAITAVLFIATFIVLAMAYPPVSMMSPFEKIAIPTMVLTGFFAALIILRQEVGVPNG